MPAYLAALLNENAEGQVGPNTPFQGFTALTDTVTVTDTVTATPHSPSSVYGTRIYGGFLYGHA